jgi:starvation-inducible DNA-binding protein
MDIQLGLSKSAREEVIQGLSQLLADTYALYLKTQNFHWNATGPQFFSLHLLYQKFYEDMAEGIDEIAERIRTLGGYAEGSFSAFQKRTSIAEANKKLGAKETLKELVISNEMLIQKARPLIHRFQELLDDVTSDMIIRRLSFHEKATWLLRSHLED